jgi:hypothetical protein
MSGASPRSAASRAARASPTAIHQSLTTKSFPRFPPRARSHCRKATMRQSNATERQSQGVSPHQLRDRAPRACDRSCDGVRRFRGSCLHPGIRGPPLPQSWCAHGALSGGLESWHAAPASIASLSAGQHARTPPRPAESRFPRSRPQQAPFTLLGLKGELSLFGGTATTGPIAFALTDPLVDA